MRSRTLRPEDFGRAWRFVQRARNATYIPIHKFGAQLDPVLKRIGQHEARVRGLSPSVISTEQRELALRMLALVALDAQTMVTNRELSMGTSGLPADFDGFMQWRAEEHGAALRESERQEALVAMVDPDLAPFDYSPMGELRGAVALDLADAPDWCKVTVRRAYDQNKDQARGAINYYSEI